MARNLALNPPYLFFCLFCFFVFCLLFFVFSLLLTAKKLFPPKKRACFVYFQCLPLFLLSLFWPATCSISLSLSLSLSCYFLSFFLLVFLILLSFGSLFFSLYFSVFFAFVSCKITTSKDKIAIFISPQFFLFLKSLFLIFVFFFADFQLCFLFNFNVCRFKKHKLKTPFFGQKGGCNKTVFLITCVLQNVKSHRFFLPPFLAKFWWMFKNTIEIGISSHV